MKRRTFLGTAGLGLTTAMAGCSSLATSSEAPETDSEPETATSGDTQTKAENSSSQTLIPAGETAERSIGTASLEEQGLRKPHHVAFGNPTNDTYQGTVTVSKAGETVFEESVEVEANASIVASLTDLGTYTTRVTVPELDVTEQTTIEPSQFTCNVTRTTISIQEDSTLDSRSVSTLMACPNVVTETAPANGVASHTLGNNSIPIDTEDNSHKLLLRNPTGETWTSRVLIENDSAAQFDGIYTVEPESTVQVTFKESGTYALTMSVLEAEKTVTEQVTPENFDCNESSTRATLDASGGLTTTTVSTRMACGIGTNSTTESSS